MSDLTRIIACKTRTQAAHEVGLLMGSGHQVVVIEGTDAVEMIGGDQGRMVWESGSGFDWILVIASRKPIVTPD